MNHLCRMSCCLPGDKMTLISVQLVAFMKSQVLGVHRRLSGMRSHHPQLPPLTVFLLKSTGLPCRRRYSLDLVTGLKLAAARQEGIFLILDMTQKAMLQNQCQVALSIMTGIKNAKVSSAMLMICKCILKTSFKEKIQIRYRMNPIRME